MNMFEFSESITIFCQNSQLLGLAGMNSDKSLNTGYDGKNVMKISNDFRQPNI